jgi:Tfp pilus assembly protein PilO
MKINKKIDKEKLIIITALVVLTVLLYGLFLAPQRKRVRAIRSQYMAAKKLLRARGIKGDTLGTLKSENKAWMDKLDEIEKKFLTWNEVNLFLNDLTRLAEGTGNKLKAVDPLERSMPVESGVEKMFVEVTVDGSYSSIIDFLKVLTDNKKLVNITDVSIEREDAGAKDLMASFVLTLFIIETKRERL